MGLVAGPSLALDLKAVFCQDLEACLCTGTTGDSDAGVPQVIL